jgi:hypothetical protein
MDAIHLKIQATKNYKMAKRLEQEGSWKDAISYYGAALADYASATEESLKETESIEAAKTLQVDISLCLAKIKSLEILIGDTGETT